MSIVYAAVAEQKKVIVRASDKPALDQVMGIVMENVDYSEESKRSFAASEKSFGHSVQYCVRDGYLFISASEEGLQQRICFAFLESIAREWFERLAADKGSWLDGKLTQHPFEEVLRREMDFFSNNPDADKIRGLTAKVADIANIMQENMQLLLKREEKNEAIIVKADKMKEKAQVFEQKTQQVRCKQCVKAWCPVCCCCYCICRPCWQSEQCSNCVIL